MYRNGLLALALFATSQAYAADITQWNFNSVPADSSTTTGSLIASVGVGSLSTLGSVTQTFASGSANGGSSDPVTVDDTGLSTLTYAAQGTSNKLTGVQFNVSTLGFEDIVLAYDIRHSNTSSRYEQVQYSLDGINFVDVALFDGNAGDTWFNQRTVDLSTIAGVNNNASFAFRVVSAFAPNTSAYAASNTGSNYATSGTWRFDMVTVSGNTIAPVPEPETFAMLLAGLGILGFSARRQQ
ncbi:MAG: PEP-CTERM sorting domain-containing protein [Methylophilus sp.]|nr:PEP-CTERM sorting domain-containing protein [Methylophilus sp.]MDP3607680.1 PEP-CTERM sorting domain-containing protein [Methylophilus sp.]